MKRIVVLITIIFLLIFMVACTPNKLQSNKFQAELNKTDTFIEEYALKSINANESHTFDVNYRVCDINELVDEKEQYWVVMFQLSFLNKTNRSLNGLQITVHFNENMQMILPNSTWYNEPIQIGPYSEKDYSHGIEYTWEALVDLISLGMLGGVDVDSFYDIYVEIKWQDGYEILCMDRKTSKWDFEDQHPVKELDETTIKEMNILAYEQRLKVYGE